MASGPDEAAPAPGDVPEGAAKDREEPAATAVAAIVPRAAVSTVRRGVGLLDMVRSPVVCGWRSVRW
ncbi:hypothetical protein GCM10009544_15580 [Streptomyces stramineus]|uniref:Uncharacterized protein n=1 Tax=Streptomyces stramineus TaxID=173861 RepID=A0ABN0ZNR7_9ACTN